MSGSVPRTLADQLRGWSDERLARLLAARPDLATPTPQDTGQLASRAGTRASALRALDQLSRLELAVLDAALALGGTASRDVLVATVHAAHDVTEAAVTHLCDLALLWGPDDEPAGELRALSVLGELLGTALSRLGTPAAQLLAPYGPTRVATLARDLGLSPSGDRHRDVEAVAARLADPEQVRVLVGEVEEQARKMLDHLEREGRDGAVETTDRHVSRSQQGTGPVDQLLARGLFVAKDRRHVAVPREVALCLRGGRTTREPVDDVPALATTTRDASLVDRAAAGAAFELVRHVELLLEHWGQQPPPSLRGGGLSVRDLKATAELLHLDEATAGLHVELAAAAGLLATGATDEEDVAWLPTDGFDVWSAGSVADRWARLAQAWLDNPRLTGLVGTREAGKPVNALTADLERAWLPETRRTALHQLAELPAGTVLATGTGVASVVERLAWLRPRRPSQRGPAVGWALEESAVVGITGLGGLSAHGRALLLDDDPHHSAPAALEPLLPDPVDHVLLQADLTAVAPGPLTQDLAHHLASMADIESRGGATVYRFSESSVRRAFDAGWTAAELHAFVTSASRTPVPQPLVYLVDDVARKFGTIRVGSAESFLRSDDEVALAELVHHPKAGPLRLRRIAPTVVVSDMPIDVLLPRLRELGASPVVEAPDGTVRLARRESHRSRSPRRPTATELGVLSLPGPPDARAQARAAARVAATVTAVRAGDRAAASRPPSAPEPTTPAATIALLRGAVEAKQSVWIGYVDNHGSTIERVVDPVAVEAGRLSAYDHRSEEVRSFAVHRITAARVVTGQDRG